MSMTRRTFTVSSLAAAAAFFALPKTATAQEVEAAMNTFTGGVDLGSDGITLIAPEIAENGNTVPIEVDAPGAEAVMVFATANPLPEVVTFNFGPSSGSQHATTRVRLAGEQEVVAIARKPDGSFVSARQNVRVTIGGCGG